MKVTSLDAVVLTGQGGGGSYSVGASNPAPGVGPIAGDLGHQELSVPATNPGDEGGAEATESIPPHMEQGIPPVPAPAPSAAMTDGGPSHEPMSQYSTQGPIPKG